MLSRQKVSRLGLLPQRSCRSSGIGKVSDMIWQLTTHEKFCLHTADPDRQATAALADGGDGLRAGELFLVGPDSSVDDRSLVFTLATQAMSSSSAAGSTCTPAGGESFPLALRGDSRASQRSTDDNLTATVSLPKSDPSHKGRRRRRPSSAAARE